MYFHSFDAIEQPKLEDLHTVLQQKLFENAQSTSIDSGHGIQVVECRNRIGVGDRAAAT